MFGSFALWGDVPALMPMAKTFKSKGMNWSDPTLRGQDFTRVAGRQAMKCDCQCPEPKSGPAMISVECPVHNWNPDPAPEADDGIKGAGASRDAEAGRSKLGVWHWTNPAENGKKGGGDWFGSGEDCSLQRRHGSKSNSRKAASAMIAKIPLPLSRHVAAVYRP
jgi:hypothetical protein